MTERKRHVYDVPVTLTTITSGVVRVGAFSCGEACVEARGQALERALVWLEPPEIQATAGAGVPLINDDVVEPAPNYLTGYRLYLETCLGTPNYPVQAVLNYADWKHSKAIEGLVAFIQLYGLPEEALDEHVHQLKSQEASSVNNGGFEDQLLCLVEDVGYEGTRQLLIQAVKEMGLPEETEEEDDKPNVD